MSISNSDKESHINSPILYTVQKIINKKAQLFIFISFKDDISLKSYTLLIICFNSVSD